MRNVSLTLVKDRGPNVPSEAIERLKEEITVREMRKLLADMPDEVLLCRRLRNHAWTPTMAAKIRGGARETLTCSRCTAWKDRYYNRVGEVVHTTNPTYPEGYLFTGKGRVGKDARRALVLESLSRTIANFEDWTYVD